jgi:hypothetical protein
MANSLSYYDASKIMAVKCFTILAPQAAEFGKITSI